VLLLLFGQKAKTKETIKNTKQHVNCAISVSDLRVSSDFSRFFGQLTNEIWQSWP